MAVIILCLKRNSNQKFVKLLLTELQKRVWAIHKNSEICQIIIHGTAKESAGDSQKFTKNAQRDARDLYRSQGQQTCVLYKQHMAIRRDTAWCICER